ncbi:hypothetical protein DUI87_04591 [Hirundo rustica rustica]|uniref:Contactin-associated protein-like 5 n=1 Tax=Hirundo rustica rustica TaxID=333673 RepID=A0A3M0KZX5_HIRRU|nr:hypothetical protein DUI87_04591 [Hirundo rustica rustica]
MVLFRWLGVTTGAGGWSPLESNKQQWLQVDLGDRVEIVAVATQGRYGSSDWVTSYALMFSDTGRNWKQYRQDDAVWVFTGNSNADSVVHHKLLHSMKARFLRFIPLKWNAGGRIGLRVEVFGCSYKSDIADFDGRSSLLYRFNQKLMSTFKDVVSLKFKSMQGDGVLFHGEGQRGDYITLELQKGKLSLHLNLGDSNLHFSNSHTSVTLGSLLDDQHWHSVLIERFNKQVNFTVDKHTQHFRTKGDSDHLDIDYEGNVTFSCSEPQVVPITFVSASTNLHDGLWHSVNINARRHRITLTLDNDAATASHATTVSRIYSGNSYYFGGCPDNFTDSQCLNPITAFQGCMRLIFIDNQPKDLILVQQGSLGNFSDLHIDLCGIKDSAELNIASCVVLSKWAFGKLITIADVYPTTVNMEENAPSPGPPFTVTVTTQATWEPLVTTIQTLMLARSLGKRPGWDSADLSFAVWYCDIQMKSTGNFAVVFTASTQQSYTVIENNFVSIIRVTIINTVPMYKTCLSVMQSLSLTFKAVYEQSCEAYRHQGKTSGFFYIDSDGSGPLGPLRVFCNITEDKIWTSVQHNSTGLTRVQGAGPEKPYTMSFNYNSSAEQLEAVINSAEYCEQEAAYHCKSHGSSTPRVRNPDQGLEAPAKSVDTTRGPCPILYGTVQSERCELWQENCFQSPSVIRSTTSVTQKPLDTAGADSGVVFAIPKSLQLKGVKVLVSNWNESLKDGVPFAWWVGRANEKHLYWGGSLPGIQQCACGLEESCLDMRYFCNCDADREEWTNDTGLLAFKDHLPVTQIVITDTNRSNSEAAWKIGPLRCYGDRQFWNAASFNTEASYLHFPTLHAEVSADISFFFKTTAVSGVFLENLGMKDFIRIEISSPKEITFSIDVGNGPTEATVQSPTPLNDNQWHYVRAERNLKQTSLQVDNLPKKVLEAPAEGHFRLQLNSQLFVGGTASRQKGFLGCIRSLHLNGQKLDLEERAKMTPGVKPGCPGHCSSYGNLCHNGGKCVEKYNGYFCDCTNSAYEGPFCKEEVSALFEASTSVTYTFQEPYPVTKNASTSSSAIYVDAVVSKENIAFSFLTAHTPSLLLYINTYFHEYLAVILSKNVCRTASPTSKAFLTQWKRDAKIQFSLSDKESFDPVHTVHSEV